MSDIDKRLNETLVKVANISITADGDEYRSFIAEARQAIKQLMVDKFEELIGEDDKWDKKYPLSIKQDIKSRNHLRIELRQKLEEWKQ